MEAALKFSFRFIHKKDETKDNTAMRILVIDDEKPTLSMFKLFLTAYGYEVYTAEDGEKGLSLFETLHPEMVFTDIKMPGMDGLEVLRRIKQSRKDAQVIIITGHGDMEKAVEALDLDASDFINKPVERQALTSALARAEKRKQMPDTARFSCRSAVQDQRLDIAISGKLQQQQKADFSRELDLADRSPVDRAVLSFDEGFSIDRSGIRLLMSLIQDLAKRNVPVVMENLSYNYVRIFQMAGMEKYAALKPVSPDE